MLMSEEVNCGLGVIQVTLKGKNYVHFAFAFAVQ
jgi:hypothetical protein